MSHMSHICPTTDKVYELDKIYVLDSIYSLYRAWILHVTPPKINEEITWQENKEGVYYSRGEKNE